MITLKLNPFHSVNGEDRGGGEVWVVFVGVGGDERELVMVYLCFCRSRLFLCLWLYLMCVYLILTIQLIA